MQPTLDPSRDVIVREVGLRDGLQIQPAFLPTGMKIAWLRAEAESGVPEIEVSSYVSPRLIPQFSDAAEVTHAALQTPGLKVSALIPNVRGAERGFELGVHALNFVMSVSRTHNEKNVRMSREESVAAFKRICTLRDAMPVGRRPAIAGGLSTAMGCTYEGTIDLNDVLFYTECLLKAGADEIIIADTVGYATPWQVRDTMRAVLRVAGNIPVFAHFHDTRGTGLANALAALEAGVTRFDASLAGLGGCPFAPGASGNIVMEDLCFMLDGMGLRTGVDLQALLAVRRLLERSMPDAVLHGGVAKAGLPKDYQSVVRCSTKASESQR